MICTKDRAQSLAAAVATLARQTRHPAELVVVDAGRPEEAGALRARLDALLGSVPVVWIQARPGLPRQRNLGAARASGSIVLFLDDDVELEPGYLEAVARVFERDERRRVGGVGGAQVPDPTPRESRWRRAASRVFLLESYGRGRLKRSGHPEYLFSPAEETDVEFLSGCNMAYRREVLAALRFDERLCGYALGEDIDFSYRVSRRWRLVLTPEARLVHHHAPSGRPATDAFRAMSVFNKYLFFRERVARRPLDWLAHLWAVVGGLLLRLRAPRARGLRGALQGYAMVARHLAFGTLPAPPRPADAPGPRPEHPTVSIVIPARDEERTIGACLDSVLAQEGTGDRLEVIVVENGSRDATRAVAAARAAWDPRVRVLVSAARNHAEALNDGIRAARGDVVARVDAHSRVAPDYVARLLAALRRHPDAVGVGGPFLPAGESRMERVAGLARSSPFGVGGGYGADRRADDHAVRSVQCGAYWRDALVGVGLFDADMLYGEDEELNWRLVRRGAAVVLCPDLRQLYRPRGTLGDLARQYWNYGRGRARVLRKHPDFVQPRHLVPSAFVAGLVTLGVAAATWSPAGAALAMAGGAYGIVLAAAGAHAWRRAGLAEASLVPVAVACMHLAYGTGLLAGAVRRGR